jgi:chaperonin cofactor prefoldin
LGLVLAGLIVALVLRARSRGTAAEAWRTRARDPFSRAVVQHDRLKAELAGTAMGQDRIDAEIAELDSISQQLNALTLDAPDDQVRQATGGVLAALATMRSALEQLRQADAQTQQTAAGLAQARTEDVLASLRSFRTTVWPASMPDASG